MPRWPKRPYLSSPPGAPRAWFSEIAPEIRHFVEACAEAGITHIPDPRLAEVARQFVVRITTRKVSPSPSTQTRRRTAVREVLRAALPEILVPDPFPDRYDEVAAGQNLPVHLRAKTYRPQIPPAAWARVRPLFEQIVVAALAADPRLDYRRTVSPVAYLLVYCAGAGTPLTPVDVLDPKVVDKFHLHRREHGGSETAYRTTLAQVERALFPRGIRPTLQRGHLVPHTAGEIHALWRWITSIPTTCVGAGLREAMVFALGAGLGMGAMRELRGTQVRRSGAFVVVDVPGRSCPVAVLAEWEDEALAAAERAGEDYVVHPSQRARGGHGILTNLTLAAGRRPPRTPSFDARRLRATWLVLQLQRGTPAKVLLAAAGLQTLSALDRLMPYVEMPPEADAFCFLRGVR